jgi:hypothetical protein
MAVKSAYLARKGDKPPKGTKASDLKNYAASPPKRKSRPIATCC